MNKKRCLHLSILTSNKPKTSAIVDDTNNKSNTGVAINFMVMDISLSISVGMIRLSKRKIVGKIWFVVEMERVHCREFGKCLKSCPLDLIN